MAEAIVTSASVECNPVNPVVLFDLVHMVRLPAPIAASPELSAQAKVLLTDVLGLKSQACWKSRRTLARTFGAHPDTISRWWAELVEAGLVSVERTSSGTNRYTVTPSCPQGSWVYIPRYLVGHVSAGALVVAGVLQNACGRDGWARRSLARLVEATGLSKGSVRRALSELVRGGFIGEWATEQAKTYAFLVHDLMAGWIRDGMELARGAVARLLGVLTRMVGGAAGAEGGCRPCRGGVPWAPTETVPGEAGPEDRTRKNAPAFACAPVEGGGSSPHGDGKVDGKGSFEGAPTKAPIRLSTKRESTPAIPPTPDDTLMAVWGAMREEATKLGHAPSVPTPRDLDGARVLVDALGGQGPAEVAARRLARRWAAFRLMFGALRIYPRPNLGAVPVISPILGWLGDEEPEVFNSRKARVEAERAAKQERLAEREWNPEVAGHPTHGWGS